VFLRPLLDKKFYILRKETKAWNSGEQEKGKKGGKLKVRERRREGR